MRFSGHPGCANPALLHISLPWKWLIYLQGTKSAAGWLFPWAWFFWGEGGLEALKALGRLGVHSGSHLILPALCAHEYPGEVQSTQKDNFLYLQVLATSLQLQNNFLKLILKCTSSYPFNLLETSSLCTEFDGIAAFQQVSKLWPTARPNRSAEFGELIICIHSRSLSISRTSCSLLFPLQLEFKNITLHLIYFSYRSLWTNRDL